MYPQTKIRCDLRLESRCDIKVDQGLFLIYQIGPGDKSIHDLIQKTYHGSPKRCRRINIGYSMELFR
jgi:hypothetical protein